MTTTIVDWTVLPFCSSCHNIQLCKAGTWRYPW